MELALSVDAPHVVEKRLSFFERYLTLWVALCMVAGVLIGQAAPGLVLSLRGAEIGQGSHINLPIALLIWLMIVPMLLKIDLAALGQVGRDWRGIAATVGLVTALGGRAEATPDGFVVRASHLHPGRVDAAGDHRIGTRHRDPAFGQPRHHRTRLG